MTLGPLPASICPLPWINFSLDVDGTSRPCCKFAHYSEGSRYQLRNLREAPLDEVWNSPAMQLLRQDFRLGRKPSECATCWREEAAGILSYRQTFVRYREIDAPIDYDESRAESPLAVDLKLTNACNLKCRICSPVASSLWLREELEQPGAEREAYARSLARDRTYYLSNKVTRQPGNERTFRRWLARVEHVEITGGEPMLSSESREIIELLVEMGRAAHVSLLFNTNVTVVEPRITRHVDRFKRVQICLSVDDLSGRLEYQRAPCDWETVQRNMDAYAAMASPRCQIYAFCSVSIFNVWYLPEYVQWVATRYGPDRMLISLNLVHGPRHQCIQVLPRALKDSVRVRLESIVIRGPRYAHVLRQVREVIKFMDSGEDPGGEGWSTFLRTTAERDAIRGEDFAKALPEFSAEIAGRGLLEGASDAGR